MGQSGPGRHLFGEGGCPGRRGATGWLQAPVNGLPLRGVWKDLEVWGLSKLHELGIGSRVGLPSCPHWEGRLKPPLKL